MKTFLGEDKMNINTFSPLYPSDLMISHKIKLNSNSVPFTDSIWH